MESVWVLAGSSPGARAEYTDAARDLAACLVERKLRLVYGGASVGLMGVVADEVLARGGNVVGVIPEALLSWEVAHTELPDLRVVGSMHERKALMEEFSDGVIALPGGIGTLEELAEMLTWSQLGIHQKPCAVLNVAGYFDPLLRFLDHAVTERFVTPQHRATLLASDDPERLLDAMEKYVAPDIGKWMDREET
jgi:uncharacterized protein (TIGR00730 family)